MQFKDTKPCLHCGKHVPVQFHACSHCGKAFPRHFVDLPEETGEHIKAVRVPEAEGNRFPRGRHERGKGFLTPLERHAQEQDEEAL